MIHAGRVPGFCRYSLVANRHVHTERDLMIMPSYLDVALCQYGHW